MSINRQRPVLMTPSELRALRKSTGLPMTRAAHALGIGYRTLWAYEHGELPAPKGVITLLQILAAKRESLVTGKRRDILDYLGQPFDISL